MPTGEVMPQLMRQQNSQERQREREARQKSRWIAIDQTKSLHKRIEGRSLIMRIRRGEVCTCDQRSDEGQDEESRG